MAEEKKKLVTEESVKEIEDEVSDIKEDIASAAKKVKEFKRLIQQCEEIQEDVKKISMETIKRLKVLGNDERAVGKKQELVLLQKETESMREIRSETRSFFLRLFLGRVNLKMYSASDRLRLRDEYNKFKVRSALIFAFFPLVVLFFHYYLRYVWSDTHWINMFYQLWLLYYYISSAIRENILLVNGSNIRKWWIYHHYIAALATIDLIVWPATEKYEYFVPYYTSFACYNGLVQNLQNIYHKRREYANRALGHFNHMDVTYQETLTEFPRELLLLLPFLFFAQLWEIFLGLMLLRTFLFECQLDKLYWTEYREELQILSAAVLQFTMGIGNFITTINTLQDKRKIITKMKSK